MINNANMTVDEVESLFANMHIEMPPPDDYEITDQSVKSEATSTKHTYKGQIPVTDPKSDKGYRLENIDYSWTETTEPVEQKYFKFKDQNITLNRSGNSPKGSFGRAGSGNFTRSPSSGKSGGGSGGGSSKQPDNMDPVEKEADRYHDVDIQLKQIQTDIDKLDKQKKKLFGQDLIGNLNKKIKLLDKQIDTTNKKIKIAQGEVGYMEKASNAQLEDKTANVGDKNYTKYGVLTGTNGQPWCASFVCWCFVQACGGDRNKAKTMLYGNLWAGCDELMGNFKKAGRFDKKPQIGDVVMFGVPGDAAHTGIVVDVNGNTITTIEGNTKGGVGLEREGNGVCIKTYDIATSGRILGFGHPAYEGTTSFAGINGTTMASTGTTGTTRSSI